jgi:hypothetical protein
MIIVITFNSKSVLYEMLNYVVFMSDAMQQNEIQVYSIKLCCRIKREAMYSARNCQVR